MTANKVDTGGEQWFRCDTWVIGPGGLRCIGQTFPRDFVVPTGCVSSTRMEETNMKTKKAEDLDIGDIVHEFDTVWVVAEVRRFDFTVPIELSMVKCGHHGLDDDSPRLFSMKVMLSPGTRIKFG